MPVSLQGRYFTTREAADVLGYTIGRVHQLVREGEIAAVHFGERFFIIPECEVNRMKEYKPTTGRPRKSKV